METVGFCTDARKDKQSCLTRWQRNIQSIASQIKNTAKAFQALPDILQSK